MEKVSSWLTRISTGWMASLALLIFLLFGAFVLPRASERAKEVSRGAGSPDTELFYSAQDLYEFADVYGPEGREAYVQARYTFDIAFPLVYGFFLATAISWFAKRSFSETSVYRFANLMPLFGVFFDFLENLSISIVMLRFPSRAPFSLILAPILSALKWFLVYGSFITLGILVLVWVVKLLRTRRNDGSSTMGS